MRSSATPRLVGANTVGLERRGFGGETIEALKHAFRRYFRSSLARRCQPRSSSRTATAPRFTLVGFVVSSKRGIIR